MFLIKNHERGAKAPPPLLKDMGKKENPSNIGESNTVEVDFYLCQF